MACSNQCAKEYVDRARVNLVGHLQNLPLIVEKLHQQKVLNSNEVSVIEAESENFNKTRKILDELWKKGEEACYQFLKILDFERKSVLAPTLHSWITLFPFRDEPEDDYIHGPSSCLEFQTLLKKNAKQILDRQWKQNVHFFGAKRQEKFTYIPVVLDTDTENNTSQNKIALKNKKSKKPRSKKMRSYIPRDTSKKSPEDLLNSKEKSILLVGKPGIGKTTVVKQMLHLWTERCDRSLDFMFYLDDNILSNDSTISTLENLLLFDTVLPNALRKKTEEILEYLQENSEKVTIIFDGISDLHNNRTFQKILEHDLLPEAKIIVTCRPETDIEDFSEWPTLKLDVQGFSEESIYAFFTQVQDCDPDLINSVLNNPALLSLCHVPMHAFMVGASFSHYASEGAQRLCTSTELYVRIFRHCIQRHGKMKLRYLEAHIEGNRNAVLDLAQRAFCKIKSKPINLQFNCKKNCVADAFLRSVSVMSPARSETFCAFLHNTMQEFFSALWLLDNPSELDEALQLCQTKESEHIKYVIPFLCGLQSETSSALLKCLFPPEQLKGSFSGFFEKISNTFLCQQPDEGYSNGVVFICQCLYEFQSSEACRQFLERVDYQLDLREEHLDPHQCCAVSYVISQSRNQLAHLDLENSFVSFSGLKTIFRHSQNLRDWSTTLCQVWMVSLESEQQNYLINLLQLCGNEIHLQTSINDEMLKKAGNIIIQSAEKINLHLHSDGDLQHLNDRLCRIIVTWLASINSLHFVSKQNQSESAEEWEKRVRSFKVNLCLQAALGQRETIQTSMRLIISDDSDEKTEFLLDLYSHLKQYETKTGRSVLPALLPVYQSAPAEWIIDLSERKAFLLLEVLKLQTVKKAVKLRGWSNQDFEVWTVLQCLPYISQLSFTPLQNQRESAEEWEKRVRSFKVNLCLQAALYQRETIQTSMRLIISDDSDEKTQFLLDLYSHMKQDETETGRSVLPALLAVYQSAPAEWIIDLSERNSSLLLEVLKLQTVKKPVKLRGWSGGESAVRSFLQCLPYISRLRFSEGNINMCLGNLFYQAAERERETGEKTLKLLTSLCTYSSFSYGDTHIYRQCDFLLDLYSHLKQYETETGRSVLPALLAVYQSAPAEWCIDLSERKAFLLLEVLKLQTVKKAVKLRGWSDGESAVRSFLQCLPYISQLRIVHSAEGPKDVTFLINLFRQSVDKERQTGEKTVELLTSLCTYSSFPCGDTDNYRQCDFLLNLYSYMKQDETETGRSVLPALLPVYQSAPAEWIIDLSERNSSLLLEVLKLQTVKKPVKLRGWSDGESAVRSFLQCLPYISQLSWGKIYPDVEFVVNLFYQAAERERETGETTLELLTSLCTYSSFPYGDTDSDGDTLIYTQCQFLLDLYSYMKQDETETGRRVLPALLPVYQSAPAEWIIDLSERDPSLILEVLKLQTVKKPVKLRGWSDGESAVRSFLQCLPYISRLRIDPCWGKIYPDVEFVVNLFYQAAERERETGETTLELLTSLCTYSSFPYGDTDSDGDPLIYTQCQFLLDLYSYMKQDETETGRRVLPALLPVYQSAPAEWIIDLSERDPSLILEVLKLQTVKKPVKLRGWSDGESAVRSFLQCLPYISRLRIDPCWEEIYPDVEFVVNLFYQAAERERETGETTLELLTSLCTYSSFPYGDTDSDGDPLIYRQCQFLLDLYSYMKQDETETGRRVLPALLPVYQSAPAEWIIDLSERDPSLLLEVLKLQTVKKPVKLRGWSDGESAVRSFLQCLPYISRLRIDLRWGKIYPDVEFVVNLFYQAAERERETGETTLELLTSLCTYSSFPYGDTDSDGDTLIYTQCQFLLDLYSYMKQDETETGRRVLPALLPVYQSAPAEWIIDLSERNPSLLLEVLKLQTVKKPVKLRGWSGGESAVRSFLQCLPYISRLRYSENVAPFIRKLAVDYAEDAELVTALLTAMNSTFTISEVLPNSKCWAMGRVLGLLASPINLTLNPQAISLSGAALLFRCVTHLHKLCLGESVVEVMAQAFRAEKARAPLVIEELSVDLKTVCSAQRLSRVLGSLSSLLNLWNVQCLNLTGCEMEAHSLIDLVCHPRSLTIRVSKQTLQQLAVLVSEVKDRKLACFFLKKVGGDLSSCSLSWEELIYFLQQQVCGVTVNGKKSKITNEHVGQLLPLLDQVHWKRVSSSVVLSIIREIYETRSAHCVPSLLNSVKYCISLNGRELDPVHCAALRFTLQHCTPVSLSLLWTSIPEGELESFLPLLSSISHLSVDRRLLLRLLHCCSLSKIQKGAEALVLCSLKNRLDFSCCIGLDLTTETQSSTLHLTPKDCSVITMAIQTAQKHTELILVDCEIEDAGVDMLFPVLHTVRLRCSKALLLQFLALVHVGTERESMVRAASLSHALGKELDLSETKLDKQTCRSLALVLEHTEGLSELDISHCQLTDHCLELLLPHLHKVDVLDLSHNDISDTLAGRIYSLVSASSNIETVRLFNNRITNQQPFLQDERFEIW